MDNPSVCAVMLTCDRPAYARQAVECFRAQTYPNKRLYVFDSGSIPAVAALPDQYPEFSISYHGSFTRRPPSLAIGELRNEALEWIARDGKSEVIVHWDDDDISHPNRIAEQVALLQSSGADVVGYREMLFCDCRRGCDLLPPDPTDKPVYQAWLYSNANPGYALGTSLCYWRKTWERKPFPATSYGEDLQFCTGLKCAGVTSWAPGLASCDVNDFVNSQPRMIARIHAGNTSSAYKPGKMTDPEYWKRVPEWDSYARSVMESQSLAPSPLDSGRGGKSCA